MSPGCLSPSGVKLPLSTHCGRHAHSAHGLACEQLLAPDAGRVRGGEQTGSGGRGRKARQSGTPCPRRTWAVAHPGTLTARQGRCASMLWSPRALSAQASRCWPGRRPFPGPPCRRRSEPMPGQLRALLLFGAKGGWTDRRPLSQGPVAHVVVTIHLRPPCPVHTKPEWAVAAGAESPSRPASRDPCPLSLSCPDLPLDAQWPTDAGRPRRGWPWAAARASATWEPSEPRAVPPLRVPSLVGVHLKLTPTWD